ncbi:MAG TPA: hypothetical protein VHH90_09920 [Polyangia bacterium]|nr:hypothetical protein [Polyangia bacterium]
MTSWRGSEASGGQSTAGAIAAGLVVALVAGLAGCGGGSGTRRPDAGRDAPTEAIPQADALLAAGRPCEDGTSCASGFCSDGVCCATECAGVCRTCAAAGSVGTCTASEIGTDPRNECDDKGPGSCGTDGFCDGAGACEKYARGVTCRQAGCAGETLTFAGRCDGLGTCVTTPSEDCGPFRCGTGGACATTCTVSADCASGASCADGNCGKRPIGAGCAASADCNSGICAQGTCCATNCDGICLSCALPGSAGACTYVPAGQDPLGQCADNGAATCGTDGLCDGAGACRLYASGAVCGADHCTGQTETAGARCDGVGDCVPGAPQSCGPYTCSAAGSCKTSCASDADCAPGTTCQGTICCAAGACALAPLGAVCAAGADCASGFCAQGVCCATSCTGTCQSCGLPGSEGICADVPAGQDPLSACANQGPTTCGTNGACDGKGKCQMYPAGTVCAPPTCAGATLTPARICDGAGNCQAATPLACTPYACNAAGNGCNATCAANADCASSGPCDTTKGSCGLAPNGAACASAAGCNSGFCAQGVCCASACTALCSSCDIPGSVGTCVAVPAGQDPLSQCADQGATSCGANGVCNGSGACQKYAAGTACAPAACAGASLTPAGACDGNGACVTPAPTSCAPYLCGAGACSAACKTSADCVAPSVCASGSCAGGCAGVTCDDFEGDTLGAMASGWTREGGSAGDWQVIADATKAFAQNHAQSSTFRLCYASGTPWSGATSVSADVKVLALGSSGTTTAMLCLRYAGGSSGDYACLALEPGVGLQVKTRASGSVSSGPVWSAAIGTAAWYSVKLSAAASGALTASLGGKTLGTYTPSAPVASGYIAVATQSAEAAFDNLVVTQP